MSLPRDTSARDASPRATSPPRDDSLAPAGRPHAVLLRTRDGRPLLGRRANGAFEPSPFGLVVRHYWHQLALRYLHIRLGPFLIMRGSLLGTLERLPLASSPPMGPLWSVTLSDAIAWFLRVTSEAYARGVEIRGWQDLEGPVWGPPAWDAPSRISSCL